MGQAFLLIQEFPHLDFIKNPHLNLFGFWKGETFIPKETKLFGSRNFSLTLLKEVTPEENQGREKLGKGFLSLLIWAFKFLKDWLVPFHWGKWALRGSLGHLPTWSRENGPPRGIGGKIGERAQFWASTR